jgi:hypothetical protein
VASLKKYLTAATLELCEEGVPEGRHWPVLTHQSTALALKARPRRVPHAVEGDRHDRLRHLYDPLYRFTSA